MADIAVFIASSRTGLELVDQGLQRGLSVRAVVRSEKKFKSLAPAAVLDNSKLSIHPCDTNSVEDLRQILSNVKTIFIACGGTELVQPAYMNQDLACTMVAAIALLDQPARPTRIVLLSAEYCHPDFKLEHPWANWFMVHHVLHSVAVDLGRTQAILEKNKELVSYTFIQPAAIVEASRTSGKVILKDKHDGSPLGYADLASAMLDAGFDETCVNGMRGAVSEIKPSPGWSGMSTQRQLMWTVVKMYLLKPAMKYFLLISFGYFLSSKVGHVFVDFFTNS